MYIFGCTTHNSCIKYKAIYKEDGRRRRHNNKNDDNGEEDAKKWYM